MGTIAALCAGLLSSSAFADRPATFWNVAEGDFFGFSNWTLGAPNSILDARIDNDGKAYIDTMSFETIPYVFIGSEQATSGTLEVRTGGVASFTAVAVGALDATGTLLITGGGQLTSFGGALGSDYLGKGTATVEGVGSNWALTSSQMVIGGNGLGNLHLRDGGSVTVKNGLGTMLLAGHPLAEGNLTIGAGGAAGTLLASEIVNGEGPSTVTFNHNEAAYEFAPKLTGFSTVNGYLDVRHEGSGTTILAAPVNNLAGRVTVASGTLLVNGTVAGSTKDVTIDEDEGIIEQQTTVGTFEVLAGGTLGGVGSIQGKTSVGGTLAPGIEVGTLTFGGDLSLVLEPEQEGGLAIAGRVKMELGGMIRGTQFDAVDVAGTLIYGGTLEISFMDGFTPEDGTSFDLFDGYSDFEGTFASITFSSGGFEGAFNPETGTLTVSTVPEPTVFGLAALGIGILGMRRRAGSGRG